ncbi:MAG: membrane protein insertion efficiency factor YidD, partial [Hyphomonas sp.]|nr:membrane protein insertion efficiency factor YidD [Hyphomonas sp.]
MGLRRRTAYALLAVYKHGPSQLFHLAGARCQHTPSCSEYGAECVARHGWWPGGWMAL